MNRKLLPSTWQSQQLKNLCLPIQTTNPKRKKGGVFRYIDISSIDNKKKIVTTVTNVKNELASTRARQLVQYGDVLVSTVRPNLNAVALLPSTLDGAICSTGFCVLRANKKLVESEFLFAWVRHPEFIQRLLRLERGIGYPSVTDIDVKNTEIPLPSLPEQRRIVEVLREADELRQLRQQANEEMGQVLSAIFYDMFGDCNPSKRHPLNWQIESFSNLIIDTQYGVSTKLSSDGDIGVLRMNNITSDGWFNLRQMKYISNSNIDIDKYGLRKGDILFNRTNSLELVGKTGLWGNEEKENFSYASYLIRIRLNERVTPEYIWALMNSNYGKQTFSRLAKQAVNMANINTEQLSSIPILLPPKALQKQFSKIFYAVKLQFSDIDTCKKEINILNSSLLTRAFNGKLTATWREQHITELTQAVQRRDKQFGKIQQHKKVEATMPKSTFNLETLRPHLFQSFSQSQNDLFNLVREQEGLFTVDDLHDDSQETLEDVHRRLQLFSKMGLIIPSSSRHRFNYRNLTATDNVKAEVIAQLEERT